MSLNKPKSPYFESIFCPNDAKELNDEYDEYYTNYQKEYRSWTEYEKKRLGCLNDFKDIPNIKERIDQFKKCGEQKDFRGLKSPSEFFFSKMDRHRHSNLNHYIDNHGIIDGYYLYNEKLINEHSRSKETLELCRQRNKVNNTFDVEDCINYVNYINSSLE